MRTTVAATHTLILGIGNILLSDDGIGIHVIRALDALEAEGKIPHVIALRDGGTIGLALLAEIEEFGAFVAVDAMQLDMPAGTVQVFQGADMDRQLGGKKRTAHEVALSDLVSAARLAGTAPPRRALVAIQPASMEWGLNPSDPVSAAVPKACEAVLSLLDRWNDET